MIGCRISAWREISVSMSGDEDVEASLEDRVTPLPFTVSSLIASDTWATLQIVHRIK